MPRDNQYVVLLVFSWIGKHVVYLLLLFSLAFLEDNVSRFCLFLDREVVGCCLFDRKVDVCVCYLLLLVAAVGCCCCYLILFFFVWKNIVCCLLCLLLWLSAAVCRCLLLLVAAFRCLLLSLFVLDREVVV